MKNYSKYINYFRFIENADDANFVFLSEQEKLEIVREWHNDFFALNSILEELDLTKKWKSFFKKGFELYKEVYPDYQKQKFYKKGTTFIEFLIKYATEIEKQENLKNKKINFSIENIDDLFNIKIGDYNFKLLTTKYDFIYYGNVLNNCLAGYFSLIQKENQKRVIVVCEKGEKPEIAIEIIFDLNKNSFRFIQKYRAYNFPLNKEDIKLLNKYRKALKEKTEKLYKHKNSLNKGEN